MMRWGLASAVLRGRPARQTGKGIEAMWFAIVFAVFLCVITFALHVFLRLSFTRYDDDPSNIGESPGDAATGAEAEPAGEPEARGKDR